MGCVACVESETIIKYNEAEMTVDKESYIKPSNFEVSRFKNAANLLHSARIFLEILQCIDYSRTF